MLTKAVESGEYLARVEPKSAVVKSALYQAHERLAYLAIKTKDL